MPRRSTSTAVIYVWRIALFLVFAVVLALAWTRLAVERAALEDILRVIGLAAIPAALALFVRGRWAPLVWVSALLVVGAVALADVFDRSVLDARPGDSERDLFGPLWQSVELGLRDYYETRVTFDPVAHPEMEAIMLFAIFGFAAVAGALAAAGWMVPAGLVFLVGVGWPATLRATVGGNSLAIGALILAAVLFALFVAGRRRDTIAGFAQAALLGGMLVLVGVGAATSTAVVKQPLLDWQRWTPYEQLRESVGVRYVWNTSYAGIRWPEDETVVLTVSGLSEGYYWRATTLDEYNGFGWLEAHNPVPVDSGQRRLDLSDDVLLPPEARDESNWVRQVITVGRFADNHLIGAPQPVRWRLGPNTPVEVADGGILFLPGGLREGQVYTVWSYAPEIAPRDLIELPAEYPEELARYLEVGPGVSLPLFGSVGRDRQVRDLLADDSEDLLLQQHAGIYAQAVEVIGDAPSPYAAAIGLEQWFRTTGGFTYEELPDPPSGDQPPLAEFVLEGRRGYCQHYAGSMALMLRLLGVPARVAAGFVQGEYNEEFDQWTVKDRDAHTWVEVWFPGFGWLPFDPTPGRGEIADTYSTSSADFTLEEEQAGTASDVIAANQNLAEIFSEQLAQITQLPTTPSTAGGAPVPDQLNASGANSSDGGSSRYMLILLAAIGAVAILLVAKMLARRLRFLGKSGRAVATEARSDLEAFLADQGYDVDSSMSLDELGKNVALRYRVDTRAFVAAVSRARFGAPADVRAAAGDARREHRVLMRSLRKSVGPVRRLRGAFRARAMLEMHRRRRQSRVA